MKFPCTSCGACCRRAGYTYLLPPDWINPDMSCKYLINNQCSIYETRPDICKIGHNKDRTGLTLREYHLLTAKICNQFMTEDGITNKLIPLTLFTSENYED